MADIELAFSPWSLGRMFDRKKCATTRKRKMAMPGDRFSACGIVWEIIRVQPLQLWEVAQYHWEAEGADSPEHFAHIWETIHGIRSFEENRHLKVYLHRYNPVGTPMDAKDITAGSLGEQSSLSSFFS